jgi:hypothetical protein
MRVSKIDGSQTTDLQRDELLAFSDSAVMSRGQSHGVATFWRVATEPALFGENFKA